MSSNLINNPALHNLYPDPHNPGFWIHSMVPIPEIKPKNLPEIAYTTQNKKLNVNGKKKVIRCPNCTRPSKKCKCKFAQAGYANSPNPTNLPLPQNI
jgi:hypothetical protein